MKIECSNSSIFTDNTNEDKVNVALHLNAIHNCFNIAVKVVVAVTLQTLILLQNTDKCVYTCGFDDVA
jgi:hypothetical protein